MKKLVAFCCENSGYPAAESVGLALKPGLELVKVPCSGTVDVALVLKCFERGADGVLIAGCPVDNCRYMHGSRRAQKRLAAVRQALKDAGEREDGVRLELLSSVDGHKLARAVDEMLNAEALNPKPETRNSKQAS